MSFRIANENERFAVYMFGRFAELKGPGLIINVPGVTTKLFRITLGTEDVIQSNELALFEDNAIPYKTSTQIKIGSKVKVTGFNKLFVHVENIQQSVICEKCGHKNIV